MYINPRKGQGSDRPAEGWAREAETIGLPKSLRESLKLETESVHSFGNRLEGTQGGKPTWASMVMIGVLRRVLAG